MFTADYFGDVNKRCPTGQRCFPSTASPALLRFARLVTPRRGVSGVRFHGTGGLSPAGMTMEALWTAPGAACLTSRARVAAAVARAQHIRAFPPKLSSHCADRYHVHLGDSARLRVSGGERRDLVG